MVRPVAMAESDTVSTRTSLRIPQGGRLGFVR
jgi:hypothetical protein